MRVYAIGDIHGHIGKLLGALDLIEADRTACGDASAPLVQVGDLVDRGPNSRKVVAHMLGLCQTDDRVTVLKGNHDHLFTLFARSGAERDGRLRAGLTWLSPSMGGSDTLASYGVDTGLPIDQILADAQQKIPQEHIEFLESRPVSAAFGDVFFAHAGICPGIPLEMQDPEDLYWIRNEFLLDTRDHGPLIVHGHTPVRRVEHHGNRLAIDTGAAYGGPVSAVVIEGRDCHLLTPDGRQKVELYAAP